MMKHVRYVSGLVFCLFMSLNVSSFAGVLNDYNPYDYSIPDNCTNVNSDLLLSGAPSDAEITKVKIYYEINHSRWSDLKIWLTAWYDGSWHDYILHEQGSISGSGWLSETRDNLSRWNGDSPNQTWYLVVRDCVTGQTGYIAFFELWITYQANEAPSTPSNPDPDNGETNVSRTADLDWSCSDPNGDVIYYTVYFEKNDSSPDNIVKNDATGSNANLGTLDYDSHYYWRVKADDHRGGVTWSPVPAWDFHTESEPIVDAEIVVSPIPDAIAGETISIPYTVTNTGNVSSSFGVGSEILLDGQILVDLGAQFTTTISPDNDYSGSYSFPIPSDWQTDTYVARAAVWTGQPGASTQLYTYDRSFNIEAQSISASITNVVLDKSSVIAGAETINVEISISNTGNQSWTFWIGASSIKEGDTEWHDWTPDRSDVILTPGLSGTVTLSWSPAGTVLAGTYGFYAKVFLQNTGTDFVYEYWQADAFEVEAQHVELTGRISFHSYSGYLAQPVDDVDGNVFIYSPDNQSKSNVTESLPVENAMNAQFSSDGSRLVFMAVPDAAPRTWTLSDWTLLEVYVYDIARDQLLRLTTNSIPGEDPKFSPNGRSILFKRNGQVFRMRTDGTSVEQLTSTDGEKSGPNYSPDGSKIVYWRGTNESADIWWMNSDGTINEFLVGLPGVHDYYPIYRDNSHIMFTRSQPDDDIQIYNIATGVTEPAAFNEIGSEDSDPFPIDDNIIGFSSWRTGGLGGWDILIGNPLTGQTISPANLNSSLKDLGGWYTPFNFARNVVMVEPNDGMRYEPGESIIVAVSAWSDGEVWSGANPSVVVEGPETIQYNGLLDNGANGDAVAGDGIYSATVVLPSAVGEYIVTARAASLDNGIQNQIESLGQPTITIIEPTGSLQVTISPSGAIDTGAQWQLDGGTWLNSGEILSGIYIGTHEIDFKPIDCWVIPDPQTVEINAGETTTETGTYIETGKPGIPSVLCTPGCGFIDVNIQASNDKNYQITLSLYNGQNLLWTQVIGPGGSLNHDYKFLAPAAEEYCFTAIASSICGDSDPAECCATPLFPPPPPTSFSAYNGCNSVTYSWGAVSGTDGYCVYINGDSVWCGTETSHQFNDLEPVVQVFTVASYNECGPGDQSTGLGKTPLAIPNVPSWCSASSDKCGYISINWENVDRESGYLIYRDGANSPIDTVGQDVTGYRDSITGTHEYGVSAFNFTCGESEQSEVEVGTGHGAPPAAQPSISPFVNKAGVDWPTVHSAIFYELSFITPILSGDTTVTIEDTSYVFHLPTDERGFPISGAYRVDLACFNDCGGSAPLRDSVHLYHIGGQVRYVESGDSAAHCWVFIGMGSSLSLSGAQTMDSILTNEEGFYRFVVPPGNYEVWVNLGAGSLYEVPVVNSSIDYVDFYVSTGILETDSPEILDKFTLFQNYPNPFNPETRIEFALPRGSFMTINVYNIVGRRIRNLGNEHLSAGRKVVTWDGRDDNGQLVSSGIYFYVIVTDNFTESKKMVLLK